MDINNIEQAKSEDCGEQNQTENEDGLLETIFNLALLIFGVVAVLTPFILLVSILPMYLNYFELILMVSITLYVYIDYRKRRRQAINEPEVEVEGVDKEEDSNKFPLGNLVIILYSVYILTLLVCLVFIALHNALFIY